ncbi:MAG: molecular chaperone HtpG [Bacteroidales bacterium]|nr:molecular chaperone HtpG [Bacteroidales bacterium]
MQKGKIGVTAENIFPIIKKFLYSENEIFLRELIANAVDATQKMKKIASVGEYEKDLGDLTIRVKVDKENKKITISDRGIGMTEEEVNKYINDVAFSSAEEFIHKYKDPTAIIGKFGLGFFSAFMVADKVEIFTQSYQEGVQPVHWVCDGSPEYQMEEAQKEDRGTDIVLHLDKDAEEYLEENRITEVLNKYAKFLPIPIAFGKKKEYDENGKEKETDQENIINDTNPIWKEQPTELKQEDYNEFYRKLYPMSEDPLFHIHLNVDYPFNLEGVLYFPKIRNNIEVQKNKIQLYANQVFVTDSVENIVPEFLTLLHGVIDSPDIPLNVSRTYLQGDPNVKKISNHITKKVADRLEDIFKNNREEFEQKWDDLKLFIEYGMMTDEKFYERAQNFALFKNTEGKYFSLEEYKEHIQENQTDKNNNLVYLYTTDKDKQYSFIENAKEKGYDVLDLSGQLDTHFINFLEQKLENSHFARVDADVIDKLIQKEDKEETQLSQEDQDELSSILKSQLPDIGQFTVTFEPLGENEDPLTITQSEFMRRMKDMAEMGGGPMNFYGEMPDSYNLVVNTNHRLIQKILNNKNNDLGDELRKLNSEVKPLQDEKDRINEANKDKKEEEMPQGDKDNLQDIDKQISELQQQKEEKLTQYGKKSQLVKQLIDLALLANNMLKGEALDKFVKRSIKLIK